MSATSGHDRHTRGAIVQLLLEAGPITAGEIGERLGISAAGVRRHLDAPDRTPAMRSPARRQRGSSSGRGRPAQAVPADRRGARASWGTPTTTWPSRRCVSSARSAATTPYGRFARRRIDTILSRSNRAGPTTLRTAADRVADALTKAGYADHHNSG